MRRPTSNLGAACLLTALIGTAAIAQQPGSDKKPPEPPRQPAPEKLTLEELLNRALKDNPDVRVAEAKFHEAEAELSRTRLQVAQKVIALQASIDAARKAVEVATDKYKRLAAMDKVVPRTELEDAETTLGKAKAELARLEAEMPFLYGQLDKTTTYQSLAFSPDGKLLFGMTPGGAVRVFDVATGKEVHPGAADTPSTGSVPEKIRKAMETPVELDFGTGTSLEEIVQYVQDRYDVPFRVLLAKKGETYKLEAPLRLKGKLPLGAALEAVQDSFPAVHFVVRDYGIVVGTSEQVPANSQSLQYFLHTPAAVEFFAKPAFGEKGRALYEGTVTRVDADKKLVTISIGSDAGLQKGYTLEVYRLKPQPKYLGTVRVVEVRPTESVGQVEGKEAVEVGDHVSNALTGK
jgi:hypothetical protein